MIGGGARPITLSKMNDLENFYTFLEIFGVEFGLCSSRGPLRASKLAA
jgi:hypothetical protein